MAKKLRPSLAKTIQAINSAIHEYGINDDRRLDQLIAELDNRTANTGDPEDDDPLSIVLRMLDLRIYQNETVPVQQRAANLESNLVHESVMRARADVNFRLQSSEYESVIARREQQYSRKLRKLLPQIYALARNGMKAKDIAVRVGWDYDTMRNQLAEFRPLWSDKVHPLNHKKLKAMSQPEFDRLYGRSQHKFIC